MKHKNALLVLIGTLLLLTGVAAYPSTTRPARGAECHSSSADLGDVVASMRQLNQEVVALRESLASLDFSSAAIVGASRAPCEGAPGQDRLVDAIESLVAALRDGSASFPTGTGGRAPGAAESPADLQERVRTLRGQPLTSRRREHVLLAPSELVARYGVPDSTYVSPEGILHFAYQSSESENPVGFAIKDGMVIDAWGE